MIRSLSVFVSIILFISNATAQEIINVNRNAYENLGQKIAFKKDIKDNLDFKQVEGMPETAFQTGKNDIFNAGTKGDVWWMKMKYTTKPGSITYLVLDYGNIDYIDIYYRDKQDSVNHIRSGTFASSSSRAYLSTEYIFALPENIRGNVKQIYVRVKATNTLLLPVKLVNGMVLAKALHNKYFWQIIYIGVAISLFLFNLLMLVLTGDRLYGLYIIRIVTLFGLYVLAYLNGYAHLLGDALGRFILIHAHVFAAIGFIATIYFNSLFLNLRKYMPGSIKYFNVLSLLWLVILVVSLWDLRAYTNRIAHILVFSTSVLILYSSLTVMRKQSVKMNPFLVCYTVGWIPICLGSVYIVLALVNVFPFEDYTLKILTGVGVLEGVLISMAIVGDRVRILRKDKEQAEQRSLRLIRERNAYLEKKIEKRTLELQLTNEKLKESNGYKDKLFSIIAHDMRSPLSSLKGVLQLADRNMLNQEQFLNFVGRIRLNTEQVQKTMDNLLNWSISQMEMQRYQPEVIALKTFLDEHLALYETLAGKKEIVIQVSCPDHVNLMADKNQLSLICRNLIDNAVKFTPQKGQIAIQVELNATRVKVCVSNSGKPISPETIARILGEKDGVTGASYGTSGEQGMGLGLQLCKEFIINLKNELKIDTTEDPESTAFSFHIPLAN